jgi:hypothetical protein
VVFYLIQFIQKWYDSNRLIEFLNKFLLEQKDKLIILDNASCQRTQTSESFFQCVKK